MENQQSDSHLCPVCRTPLPQSVLEDGDITHPTCDRSVRPHSSNRRNYGQGRVPSPY